MDVLNYIYVDICVCVNIYINNLRHIYINGCIHKPRNGPMDNYISKLKIHVKCLLNVCKYKVNKHNKIHCWCMLVLSLCNQQDTPTFRSKKNVVAVSIFFAGHVQVLYLQLRRFIHLIVESTFLQKIHLSEQRSKKNILLY